MNDVRQHVYHKCPSPCPNEGHCRYCDGGLLWCDVCKCGESELGAYCPGPPAPTPDEVLSQWHAREAGPGSVYELQEALRTAIQQRDSAIINLELDRKSNGYAILRADFENALLNLETCRGQLSTVEGALQRLVNACYPLDMWLGGHWSKPLSNDEQHEFVLALSEAMGLVPEDKK